MCGLLGSSGSQPDSSGNDATLLTALVCPCRVCRVWPEEASQLCVLLGEQQFNGQIRLNEALRFSCRLTMLAALLSGKLCLVVADPEQ